MFKNKQRKLISIIISLLVVMSLISLKNFNVKADVSDKPEFDIEFSAPETAIVGEDIVVKGQIIPKPFEIDIENMDTEIIMVMDRATDKKNQGEVFNPFRNDISSVVGKLSLEGNVKLGLIDYSTYANIFKDKDKSLFDITDKNKIADAIGKLKSDKQGYSNTGEALRKAAYLMESSESDGIENKIIVLLSDGTPTARTSYVDGNNEYPYIDINKEDYVNAQIQTSESDYTKDIEYAKTIGNIIKEKGYTVYTVGYNTDDSGEAVLRDIHKSMTGYNLDNKEDDIKNRFYIIEDKKFTVQEIFNLIEKDILETYTINNINMNINFTGNFSLNIGGNTVDLSNINYKLVSKSNGKARYEAEPIPFEFVIKANTVGYQQIFDKVTITYPWKDSIEKIDINKELFITIKPNELPSILAKLVSSDKLEINKDEEITLKYEIIPEDFIYNNVSNSGEKDILFLIDTSNTRNNSNIIGAVKNQLFNKILSQLRNENTKYSIITFNNEANILVDFNYVPHIDDGGYENSINEKFIKNLSVSGNESNIGKALALAEDVFKTSRATASKNIVILSNDSVIYTEDEVEYIKNSGVNIITMSYNKNNSDSELYKLHKYINGKEDDILFANDDQNAINNYLMDDVRKKIQSFSSIKPYYFNPIIYLNLGSNFEPKSGIIRATESNKENIGIVEVPTITYNLTQNNNYHAESQIIEIKLKANNLSPGIYTFGNTADNIMEYKTLLNKDIYMTIKTPIIIVKDEIKIINHGLYNGINNGQVYIQENNNSEEFEIAKGSTVTFGANFTFSGSSTEFELNIDNNFNLLNVNDIKIYKVLKDSSGKSSLEEVNDENKTISRTDNKFKISINNIKESNTEILVVYQGKIKEEVVSGQTLTNEIKFSNDLFKNVTVIIPDKSNEESILPDLF